MSDSKKKSIFAHSVDGQPVGRWQTMVEHATQVATLARRNSDKFGAGQLGEMAGLLHDLGKYSDDFQRKLHGTSIKVDHSTAGARIAAEKFASFRPLGQLLAYVIAGHHAGLANGTGEGSITPLKARLTPTALQIPNIGNWQSEITLPATLKAPPLKAHQEASVCKQRNGFFLSVLTRMLFSSLVDADRLDTEAFYRRAEGLPPKPRGDWCDLAVLKRRLDTFMTDMAATAVANATNDGQKSVNFERAKILAAAHDRAALDVGLFSLTVPTGGGKTLASLTFALDHAIKHGLDRVIYVIPFTSIIEQTAKVFRGALGAKLEGHVVEHHSAFRADVALKAMQDRAGNSGDESSLQAGERMQFATENWDAPIIVTTAVQFFESLFSNRPSQCRKLHNISKSVVILDEAQTLPVHLLRPCVAMLDELARNYRTSIVLCTATQPALEAVRSDGRAGLGGGLVGVREIVDDPQRLYKTMQRVTVKTAERAITDDALVDQLRQHKQVLCIVGTRAHARDLYVSLAKECPEHTFHLSALMCPAHRSEMLDTIKAALKSDTGPCRVVATTVIEAGVDVDFPIVYRAMAGLDSIAQAAGRCNREGRRDPKNSIVQLFEIEGRKTIRELRANEEAAREVLRAHAGGPLCLAAIEAYFDTLYWRKTQGQGDGLDASRGWPNKKTASIIFKLNERAPEGWLPFEDVAKAFRMIDSVMEPVIIPFDDTARHLIAELATTTDVGAVARKLQPYIVNVPKQSFADMRNAGSVQPAHPHRYDEQFVVLDVPGLYSSSFGLDWSDPTKRAPEDNLF